MKLQTKDKKTTIEIFYLILFLVISVLIIRLEFTFFQNIALYNKNISHSFFYTYLFASLPHFIILIQIIALLFIFGIKLSRRSFKEIGIYWPKNSLTYFIYGAIAAILAAGYTWIIYYYSYRPTYLLNLHGLYNLIMFLPFLIIAFLLEATYEEIIFRSWLLVVLKKISTEKVAIIIGGLLFGLSHLLNPHYTLYGGISMITQGMFLSYLFFKTGTIWMPTAFHATWNLAIEQISSSYLFKITLLHGSAIHHVSDMEATPGAIISVLIVWGIIIFLSKIKLLKSRL